MIFSLTLYFFLFLFYTVQNGETSNFFSRFFGAQLVSEFLFILFLIYQCCVGLCCTTM